MNSADSNEQLINILSNTVIYLYKYLVPLFYILGNIGNLISALIFSKKSWRKNVCVFYFKIYILCTSIYINSTMLGSIFISGFNIQLQNSREFLCKIYFYFAFLFSSLPPTILILASIDRLLISSQNIDTRLYSSKRLAYFSISASATVWTVYNLHILIKVHIQEIFPLVFLCYYDLFGGYLDFINYSAMILNWFFYLLMLVLSMIAFKNIRHIRVVPRQQRNQIRTMTKKDFQLLRCLFAQDVVFIILTLYLNAYYIYSLITKDQIRTPTEQAIINFMQTTSALLYNISVCLSFFVFISISKAFRQEVKRIVYKICSIQLVVVREEQIMPENVELNVVTVSTIKV